MIEKCVFGSMTIDGRSYNSDVMIRHDGKVIDGWWRREGHNLCLADIQSLVDDQPDVIVIGTGIHGVMQVPEELVLTLSRQGIQLQALKTPTAAETFNRLNTSGEKVAGGFHLTC